MESLSKFCKDHWPRPEDWRKVIAQAIFGVICALAAVLWAFCAPLRDPVWNYAGASHSVPGWFVIAAWVCFVSSAMILVAKLFARRDPRLAERGTGVIAKVVTDKLLTESIFLDGVEIEPAEVTVVHGTKLRLTYLVSNKLDVNVEAWLGANLHSSAAQKMYMNHVEDKPVVLEPGTHRYQRIFTVTPDVMRGPYELRVDLWHGIVAKSSKSALLGKQWPAKTVSVW